MVVLIHSNTVGSYLCGSKFYGLDTKYSDFDLISFIYLPYEDVLSGRDYYKKNKFTVKALGICDVTDYHLTHFLGFIESGNINFIELILNSAEMIYINPIIPLKFWKLLTKFAADSISTKSIYNLMGLALKKEDKIENHGYYLRWLLDLWRLCVEAECLISSNGRNLICKYPEIIQYEKENYDVLYDLYETFKHSGNIRVSDELGKKVVNILYRRRKNINALDFNRKEKNDSLRDDKHYLIYLVRNKVYNDCKNCLGE